MKADVVEEAKKPAQIKAFPRMYRAIGTEYLVLFTESTKGTVMNNTNVWKIGEYNDGWLPCTDSSRWLEFTGSVTLSND